MRRRFTAGSCGTLVLRCPHDNARKRQDLLSKGRGNTDTDIAFSLKAK